MPDRKVDELLAAFGGRPNADGRAPMLRYMPVMDVLMMERVRARDVGHGAGVADGIRALLSAESKREAQKFARTLLITGQEFFDLVQNCATIRHAHEEGHRQDTPEARGLTSEERVSLLRSKRNPDPKFLGKIRDGWREQRYISWHTFTSVEETARWHCFFYEMRDVHGDPLTGASQSEAIGPHLHYASYLFHTVSLAEFVSWMKPGARLPHDTHVAFRTSFTVDDLAEAMDPSG